MSTPQIAPELVEEAWKEVGAFSARRMAAEARRLMGAQNELFSFVLETTLDLSDDAHELAMYMAAVIYRAYEKALPSPLPRIRPRDVIRAYRDNETWLEGIAGSHERIVDERILPNLKIHQPAVMAYVGECLFEPEDEDLELTEEDQGQLFLTMKTFVDVLDRCAGGEALPRPRAGKRAREAPVYQLKVALKGIRPPIWRRLLVPADLTLEQLHDTIQIVMGWTDSHPHVFRAGDQAIGVPDPEPEEASGEPLRDEGEVRLSEVAGGERVRITYEYDFGDSWVHEILVEKVLPPDPSLRNPVCVKGRRACPPEDCGGPRGYAEVLEALADPEHPEHEEVTEWVGPGWDPEHFDPDEANVLLEDFVPLEE